MTQHNVLRQCQCTPGLAFKWLHGMGAFKALKVTPDCPKAVAWHGSPSGTQGCPRLF